MRRICFFSFYIAKIKTKIQLFFCVLVSRLFLLLAVEGEETDVGDLDNLEANPGNITLGVTGTTETSDEDLIVFFDVVEATIVGDEGDDLLAVLDELDTDALTDGGVGLLGLNTELLKDDTLGVRRAREGVGLQGGAGVGLLPALVGPLAAAAEAHELAGGVSTVGFSHFIKLKQVFFSVFFLCEIFVTQQEETQ